MQQGYVIPGGFMRLTDRGKYRWSKLSETYCKRMFPAIQEVIIFDWHCIGAFCPVPRRHDVSFMARELNLRKESTF